MRMFVVMVYKQATYHVSVAGQTRLFSNIINLTKIKSNDRIL